MRADLVENGEFTLERGNDGRHAGIARHSWREVFHGKNPDQARTLPRLPARVVRGRGDGLRIALIPYGNLQRETT